MKPKSTSVVFVIPRRVVFALGLAALVMVVWRIQQPPVVLVQRLDSPDGERRAFLQRTKYTRDHLRVRVAGGGPSFVAYMSPAYDHDFRVDLGERLRWSEDGEQLTLRIGGRDVWRYEFATGRGRDLDPADAW